MWRDCETPINEQPKEMNEPKEEKSGGGFWGSIFDTANLIVKKS